MAITADSLTIASASREATEQLIKKHNREFRKLFATRLQAQLADKTESIRNAVSGASARNEITVPQAREPREQSRRQSHLDTPVMDSNDRELEKDMKVRTPDGGTGRVMRFNRSQGRVVVERENGDLKMVVGHRLTIIK